MKKILTLTIITLLALSMNVFAAGECVVTSKEISGQYADEVGIELAYICTGDSVNGSIPDTSVPTDIINKIRGMYLYRLITQNTSAQADVSDNSDVYFKTEMGNDLLNGDGVDALDKDVENYVKLSSVEFMVDAMGTPYLDVDNNSGASCVYTITLIFVNDLGN